MLFRLGNILDGFEALSSVSRRTETASQPLVPDLQDAGLETARKLHRLCSDQSCLCVFLPSSNDIISCLSKFPSDRISYPEIQGRTTFYDFVRLVR